MAQFQKGESGNPLGRPRGIQDRRATLRAALEGRADELLATAVEKALSGDTAVLIALLSKLIPRVKPESLPLAIPIEGVTPTEKTSVILDSVFSGALAPSLALELLCGLESGERIREADDIRIRVEMLEKKFGAKI